MSRPAVMRTPAYDRARKLAEASVWRAIESPAKQVDEELEVQIALDSFAEQVVGIISRMPVAAIAPAAPRRWSAGRSA